MNYTVIYTVSMNMKLIPSYEVKGCSFAEKTFIPVNAILPEQIEDGSSVDVIVIAVADNDISELVEKCVAETNRVLEDKGCTIKFSIIKSPFDVTKEAIGRIYCSLLALLKKDNIILADITFGPKYIPVLIIGMLSYAERFLSCRIDSIIYGQVNFNENREPVNPRLCDVSIVYMLSSFGQYFGNSKTDYDKFLKGFLS